MTIDKLPSGSYRVRLFDHGKRYNFTFDHKPTEVEVMMKLSNKTETVIQGKHIQFKVAANEYCKLKENVLSVSTIRSYKQIYNNLSDEFNNLYIDELSDLDVKLEVNRLAKDKAPKTVKNYYGFITAVIRTYRKDFNPEVKLPQKIIKDIYTF